MRAPAATATVGFTPNRSSREASRKPPEFSNIPLTRAATAPPTPWPRSSAVRLWSNEPPSTVSARTGAHCASLFTRLSTPPPPPRPKTIAFAPLSASTRSTL